MSSQNTPLLRSVYSRYDPQVDPSDPTKVSKNFWIFQFLKDRNTAPWHVPSPLNLIPDTTSLPMFKDYLAKFLGNDTYNFDENLNSFLNSFNNIGAHTNDVCMRIFVNTLE